MKETHEIAGQKNYCTVSTIAMCLIVKHLSLGNNIPLKSIDLH